MTGHPSRRTVLGLLAAAGAVVASGVYALKTTPGVKIDAVGIAALTRDVKEAKFQTFGRRLALEGGARAAGFVGLDTLARGKWTAASFSQLERKVVTFFILGSNLLDLGDPRADLVTYVEAPLVCPNRFAEYD